jgi:hypothetical protein
MPPPAKLFPEIDDLMPRRRRSGCGFSDPEQDIPNRFGANGMETDSPAIPRIECPFLALFVLEWARLDVLEQTEVV